MKLRDWNGREIEVETSRGGIVAVRDFTDNLIGVDQGGSCPVEIIQKLLRSRHSSTFDKPGLAALSARLGYYSDLQSLQSDEAITWSVFGTVSRADDRTRAGWTARLFARLGLQAAPSDRIEISLWRRIPLPESPGVMGPESDFIISTPGILLLGTTRWKPGAGRRVMRSRIADSTGPLLAGTRGGRSSSWNGRRLVNLSITLWDDPGSSVDFSDGSETHRMSWQHLVSLEEHPDYDEVNRYYDWKLSLLKA